ncbi:MAG TPA: redoxin domain-containing protein [Phycisphaerales bacterium]|nr:redoxin domain-containing protein [Phycisphaerales bacterium]
MSTSTNPNAGLTARENPPLSGEAAPDFVLKDQDRNDWRLSEQVKQGDVVLCFFPMAFTAVCSTEMQCITQEMDKWKKSGAQVVGVSCDSFAVLKAWADATGLKQTLLADMHRSVCKAYGLYWADLNISGRGTVVIGHSPAGECKVKWSQKREIKQAMSFDEVLTHVS